MKFASFSIIILIITGVIFVILSHGVSGKLLSFYSGKDAQPRITTHTSGEDRPKPLMHTSATPTKTPSPTPVPQDPYYIALGDSFAFGFHLQAYEQEEQAKNYSPASFSDGYDALVFRGLSARTPGIQEVNFSCPGETTDSFIHGGCSFHTVANPLHTNYSPTLSQFQAVKEFLLIHPGRHTITLDIGVNDAINLSIYCQQQSDPVACYKEKTPGVLASAQQNYDTILTMLQNMSPSSDIVLIKYPIPVGQDGSGDLTNGMKSIVDSEVSIRHLKVAYTDGIFNGDTVCSLTNYCSDPSDFHPNKDGYAAMASVILAVCTE